MIYDSYTDKQLVDGILHNDKLIIEYFFCRKCSKLFSYIVYSVYSGKATINELINEFYLYISTDNWRKVRQFDFRSKLMTWIGVVAIRFFQKKREQLIENNSTETQIGQDIAMSTDNLALEQRIDLQRALNKLPNQRYRMVIEKLDLQDLASENLAEEMGISVDNLYNIHRRALLQLKMIMTKKEDYYG